MGADARRPVARWIHPIPSMRARPQAGARAGLGTGTFATARLEKTKAKRMVQRPLPPPPRPAPWKERHCAHTATTPCRVPYSVLGTLGPLGLMRGQFFSE